MKPAEVARLIEGIDGWLTIGQALRLADAAAAAPAAATIVEIGSFRGRSTVVLATAAPSDAVIVAIDPHAGNDRGPRELDGYHAAAATDRELFERNLVDAGVDQRVTPVAAFSADAHDAVDGAIDVLYIDGAHRYAPARTDIDDWGSRVSDGGRLLIHDAFSSVGVTAAICRQLLVGGRFRYVGRERSLAEYRADLRPGLAPRIANAARQAAELVWFVRNVAIKAFLVAGGGRLLERLGRRPPEWPY